MILGHQWCVSPARGAATPSLASKRCSRPSRYMGPRSPILWDSHFLELLQLVEDGGSGCFTQQHSLPWDYLMLSHVISWVSGHFAQSFNMQFWCGTHRNTMTICKPFEPWQYDLRASASGGTCLDVSLPSTWIHVNLHTGNTGMKWNGMPNAQGISLPAKNILKSCRL